MIVVYVQVKVNPTKRADFIEQANKDAHVSRGFPGSINFSWSEDLENQNTFLLYEEWDSLPSFDKYRNSPEFKQAGEKLFPMMAGEPKTAYYNAASL